MPRTFVATLEQFRDMKTQDMRYVAQQGIQDVVIAAQTPQVGIGAGASGFEEGKIPVVSSELVKSLSVDGGAQGPESYVQAIAGLEIGDVLTFAWNAPHALPMEAGYTAKNGRAVPGRFFVMRNAERFSEFVENRVREVR